MHPLREKNKIPEKASIGLMLDAANSALPTTSTDLPSSPWQKFTASSRANKMHMGRIPIWNPKLAKIIGKEIKKSTKTT